MHAFALQKKVFVNINSHVPENPRSTIGLWYSFFSDFFYAFPRLCWTVYCSNTFLCLGFKEDLGQK